jgi:hypothetical protein
MPGGATYGLLQLGPTMNADGKLLSTSVGGLVLIGYTVAAVALATGERHDLRSGCFRGPS